MPAKLILAAATLISVRAFAEEVRGEMIFVEHGQSKCVREVGEKWTRGNGCLVCTGRNYLYAGRGLGRGDFHIWARLSLDQLAGTAAAFVMDGNQFGFEGAHRKMFVNGPIFGRSRPIGNPKDYITPGEPFRLDVVRKGRALTFQIGGRTVWTTSYRPTQVHAFGLRPWRATMRVYSFAAKGLLIKERLPMHPTMPKGFTIPIIDISDDTHRHVIVAPGTETDYRGQVNTVLMADDKTMFAVWSIGHGGMCGPMKKSADGGRTWSDLLPTPENWRTIGSCPCIFRLTDAEGVERLFVFAGRPKHYQSMSVDGGKTWTPMAWTGMYKPGGNTVVIPIDAGRRHLLLVQRGPQPDGTRSTSPITVWQAVSSDGGLTWEDYHQVCAVPGADPCEPELVRSPDGRQLLCLMRENRRRFNSLMMISNDEGQTWSAAKELPASLTGDRHMSCYAPDGRLVVAFRDMAKLSPTKGSYVAWVGTYDDVGAGREGQYRVKLLHQHGAGSCDCGYSGVECLPDGTLLATTYVKYRPGPEKNSIVSVRFKLEEIDRLAAAERQAKPAH